MQGNSSPENMIMYIINYIINILYTQREMGNICNATTNQQLQLSFHNFTQRNTYYPKDKNSSPQQLHNHIDPQRKSPQSLNDLAVYLQEQPNSIFLDVNFNELGNNAIHLHKLYNYQRQQIQHVYLAFQTRPQCLEQKDLQLSYLTTVFYEICRNRSLRDSIFLTKKINSYYVYAVKLFCNGNPTTVVIDERIPLQHQSPKYLNMNKVKQIWPYLLEKAWCKQIGSYPKAKGLSPEDAFQQITGIPAYSYSLSQMTITLMEKYIHHSWNQGQWVCFTALQTNKYINSRQVFHLERIQKQSYVLRSPYFDYVYKDHKKNQNKTIHLSIYEIKQIFQFMTIGFVCEKYSLKSLRHISNKRQQKIYKITLHQQSMLSARFLQFYEQYLSETEQPYYRYSPVFMELYDSGYRLLEQGCPKSAVGNKSAHLSQDVMISLKKGQYYLRIQVDWLNQMLINEGQLVLYGHNVEFELLEGPYSSMIAKMNRIKLDTVRNEEIVDDEQKLAIISVELENQYVIEVRNGDLKDIKIQINFHKSQNIRVRGRQLEDYKLKLDIKGRDAQILEILPENTQQTCQLGPFQIAKLS